jgi:hypothetical protein
MSTRATIKFTEGEDVFFAYRHSDGFPENILDDIKNTIETSKKRWSDPELGLLFTLFLAKGYDYKSKRLPDYKITPCFHGDESYKYFVNWNCEKKDWDYGVL